MLNFQQFKEETVMLFHYLQSKTLYKLENKSKVIIRKTLTKEIHF